MKTLVHVQSWLAASLTSQRSESESVSLKLIPCCRMMLEPKIPVDGLVFLYEKMPAAGGTKTSGLEMFAWHTPPVAFVVHNAVRAGPVTGEYVANL